MGWSPPSQTKEGFWEGDSRILLVSVPWGTHSVPSMSEQMQAIIRGIEAERDEFVRRCNAAIEALRGDKAAEAARGGHRFTARVAPRPVRQSTTTGVGARSRPTGTRPRAGQTKAALGATETGAAKSVKDMIREAVLSQTQPFTLRQVRDYIEAQFPGAAAKIPSERYSKELYALRVSERLFDISSKGEKGGAHVYKLKAA